MQSCSHNALWLFRRIVLAFCNRLCFRQVFNVANQNRVYEPFGRKDRWNSNCLPGLVGFHRSVFSILRREFFFLAVARRVHSFRSYRNRTHHCNVDMVGAQVNHPGHDASLPGRAKLESPTFWQAESKKEEKRLLMLGADVSLFRTLASMLSLFHILSARFFTSYNIECWGAYKGRRTCRIHGEYSHYVTSGGGWDLAKT